MVWTAALQHAPSAPIAGAVRVELRFRLQRPAGHLGTGKNAGTLRPSAPRAHTGKPDLDNLIKLALDVLKKAGFYRDDSQVDGLTAAKAWASSSARPGVDVLIEPTPIAALADDLEPKERREAKERQKEHGKTAPGKHSRKVSGSDSRDRVASACGVSAPTLKRIREVPNVHNGHRTQAETCTFPELRA
jgi:Holliday junction resolvase RusA-like endonuclease